MTHRAIRILAHAKINWTLEVLDRRSDGFHEIATVLQTIDLADVVTLAPARGMTLAVEGPEAGRIESPGENLAWEAALLLRATYGVSDGAAITIDKRIPLAAGLGGGSSDATATLRGLARLWGIDADDAALVTLAAMLGSDPPFFVHGGAALAEGRGERVTPLPDSPPTEVVLLPAPPSDRGRKTARLFAMLTPGDFSDGTATRRLADSLASCDATSEFIDATYVNAFDTVADRAFPGLAARRHALEQATGRAARLAGSGPTLYVVAPVASDALPAGAIRSRTIGREEARRMVEIDE